MSDVDGTLYFSDPGDSSLEQPDGALCAVAADGTVERIAEGMALSNGVAVTPDGATLMVAETYTGVLHRYSLRPENRYRLDIGVREQAPFMRPW